MISQIKSISIYLALALLLIQSPTALSGLTDSDINISSSFNPVGSGARALGMGSAFIAIADDATAASWNPSGLIQLRKPEFAIVGSYVNRREDSRFSSIPEANTNESVSYGDVNYLSASVPCGEKYCGKNMVFSINYQNLYNFDAKMKQQYSFDVDKGFAQVSNNRQLDYRQTGNLYALGLAYAIQVTDDSSLGFSLNIWDDFLRKSEWKQHYISSFTAVASVNGEIVSESISNEDRLETNKFSGINANIGAFWKVFEQDEQKIILGVVVKTPFTADVKRTIDSTVQQGTIGNPLPPESDTITLNEQYKMPISYGFGISYQVSDAFTMAADVYRTEWSDFIKIAEDGEETIGFGSTPASDSKVKGTTQVRLGAEYRIISQDFGVNYIIPIRTGFFYDPVPTNGSPDSVYGVSVGTGIAYDMFVLDIAYQYRFGFDLSSEDFTQDDFSKDLHEHTLYTSLFIRF